MIWVIYWSCKHCQWNFDAKVLNWFQSNEIFLNQGWTKNIILSQRHKNTDFQANLSKTVKFLEVFINDELTWTPHIDYLSTRLSRVVYLLGKLHEVVPKYYEKSAYFVYIQVWTSLIRKLLKNWRYLNSAKNIFRIQYI